MVDEGEDVAEPCDDMAIATWDYMAVMYAGMWLAHISHILAHGMYGSMTDSTLGHMRVCGNLSSLRVGV